LVEQVAVNHLVVGSIPALRVIIPQFDFSTLSIVLFSSLISASLYYLFLALKILPEIVTVFKFRTKKLFKVNLTNLIYVFFPNLFIYNIAVKQKKNL
jgi:hypothetical protein